VLALSPGYHHVNLSAAAFRADESLVPIGHRHLGPEPLCLFGGIGLKLMAAISAPYDQAHTGAGRAA
jgi:hypothetical protein